MGIAVTPIRPMSHGDRKTYPARPSLCRKRPAPRLSAWARPDPGPRRVGSGAVVNATNSSSPRLSGGQAMADLHASMNCAAASAGVARPYCAFSAALISSD